ncbi:hypothetical protein [Exiguobacterium sp. s22]|uniref:hypothetical protein n=1 Tax=Exiguobacterium sp. s22 TaxID=2751272 RepID=UPI001BEB0E02|nr:hypothetical protein [Exiguobacterium sp. s22]
MNYLRKLRKNKEHVVIFVMLIVLVIFALMFQYSFSGFHKDFWLSLIPNIIIDCLFIFIVSYLISSLLKSNEKKQMKTTAYKMLKLKYRKLSLNLGKRYVNYISKEPHSSPTGDDSLKVLISRIENISENISDYVDKDFYKKDVKTLRVNPGASAYHIDELAQEQLVDMQNFTWYLKRESLNEIDTFLLKYSVILPDDLREILFDIDILLHSGFLMTGNEFNIDIDISNATFSIEELSNDMQKLGGKICELLKYFDDM